MKQALVNNYQYTLCKAIKPDAHVPFLLFICGSNGFTIWTFETAENMFLQSAAQVQSRALEPPSRVCLITIHVDLLG